MAAVWGYKFGQSGVSGQILCAREHLNSLAESSLEEIKSEIGAIDWLKGYYDVGTNYIRSRDGRINFIFAGLRHNVDSIKSKGRILLAWVDEAEPVSELAWNKLIPTVRGHEDSEIWVTWNPENPDSPTNIRYRENPPENSKIVRLNWQDNPWFPMVLNQERLEDFEKRRGLYPWIWEGAYNTTHNGAIYAELLSKAKELGRITKVPYEPGVPVIAAWDLGRSDDTVIWFGQMVGFQPRIIDYYEDRMKELDHYADIVKDKPYKKVINYLPHDGGHKRLGMQGSIKDQLEGMGLTCEVLPVERIWPGVMRTRTMLQQAWFDEDCETGLHCLRNHKRKYNEVRCKFDDAPYEDWTIHCADAFRYLSQAFDRHRPEGSQQASDLNGRLLRISSNGGGWMS